MKKFKTSAQKQDLHEASLAELLAEKNLVRNALINYTNLPLGLSLAALMLASAAVDGQQLLSLPSVLFAQMGIGCVALFYMLKSYSAFARHRARLSHVRNRFVSSKVLPGLFAALVLYMAMPFNLKLLALMALEVALVLLYHLALKQLPQAFRHLLAAGILAFPLFIPALAMPGAASPLSLGIALAGCLILLALSQLKPGFLHLAEGLSEGKAAQAA